MSSSVTIQTGKVVQLAYSLKNSDGEVLDQADRAEPFTYLHGASQIVPGLENGLEGLAVGAKKNVVVQPEAGYGEVDEQLIMSVKRSQFPADMEIEEGMMVESRSAEGHVMVFTVASIDDEEVSIDGNHPLAGETLHFDVEVLEVRDATEEEKAHGHAHGPDGHGHDDDHEHEHEHEHGEDCDHDHDDEGGHHHH